MEPFLAVDWGTTNRRIYLIEGDRVLHTERDGGGVASRPDFAAEVEAIRNLYGHHRIVLAGMVGSSIGWKEAPYVPCPAGLGDLAKGALDLGDGIYILPGVSRLDDARADVMRGEEVQLIGAVEAGLAPPDALLVQPGTHCKWAAMSDGAIARFTTAMTGELFALLRDRAKRFSLALRRGWSATFPLSFLASALRHCSATPPRAGARPSPAAS
mgnify:CR=1 FL=1